MFTITLMFVNLFVLNVNVFLNSCNVLYICKLYLVINLIWNWQVVYSYNSSVERVWLLLNISYFLNVHSNSDQSFADAKSSNITILPLHMPLMCNEFVFGIGEEERKESSIYWIYLYDNNFILIIDIYFYETFSTPNLWKSNCASIFRHPVRH